MQRFNGQLINQFPNTINGNAAAGAKVTIRVKSSGALALLYATDSLSGGTLPNPITADAKGYYGFYAPDGVYTLDVNIAGTPQLEIQCLDVIQTVDAIGGGSGLVGQAASAALVSIAADVAAVDSARVTAQSDINADVAVVESSKSSALTNIAANSSDVANAKTSALSSITADVNAVDASRVTAQADMTSDVSAVDASRISSQAAMAAAVDAVDASRNSSQSLMAEDVATVDAEKASSLTLIADDVAAVDSAKSTALTDIAEDVSTVDTSKVSAVAAINADAAEVDAAAAYTLTSIGADIASVTSAANNAVSVEIPAQINRLGLQYPPINYVSGLTLDSYTKTYLYGGLIYIFGGTLGTVTNGAFSESGWQPLQGDLQLRNEVTQGTSIIKDVKHVDSVAALRLLAGSYDGQSVDLTSYYSASGKGGGSFRWDAASTATDDGGVTFAVAGVTTGRWVRVIGKCLTLEMFGAKVDGVTNDRAAVLSWGQFVINSGITGSTESSGECLIGSGVTYTLNNSASFDLSAGFVFKASTGFPAQKMFLINTGSGEDHVFRWRGGQLNGENIPLSGSGQANDMFYFTAANCARCDLYFDRTYSGEDWLNSGSDSHVFVAGVRNVRVGIGDAVGAFDSAVYISGDFAGVVGENCEIYGNYTKCNVAAIVKRRFKTTTIDINTTDCKNGGGSGGADISGFASAPGGDGLKVKVNALRTERPCFFQATSGAIVEVVSRQIGVTIDGYTSTDAFTVLLSGSSNISGDIVVDGVNPACTVNGNFVGVRSDQRIFATGTYNPENNNINIIAKGIGRSVLEDAVGSNNIYYITESGNFFPNSIAGTGSKFIQNSLAGYLMDAGFIRLANGFRVQKVDNAVNNIRVDGALTSTASGCVLATEGADASIPLSIIPKGTANTFIGGSAGAESLRVGKGSASGNAIEIPSAAAGQSTKIMSRGTDSSVDITIEPKGVGKIIFTISRVPNFADDAAASAGGVPVGGIYRTGSALKIRVS